MSGAGGTLVVSAFTPTVGSGQGLRTYGVVRALAELGPVDLLYARFAADRPAAEFEAVENLTMIPVQPSRGGLRALTYAQALVQGVPRGFARGATRELAVGAEELAAAAGRDRIVADGPVAAASLRKLAGRRPVTYNAHNLESSFRHLIGLGDRREQGRLERFEVRLLRSSDEVWMASPTDVEAARELVPEARIRYVPNVIDTTEIQPASDPAGGVVLFVGDFTYPPNSQGLEYLESEVLPVLWSLEPAARIEVVGRGLDRQPRDSRISYLGFVPDLAAAYGRSACVVVPLLSGGGSPLKFVEALAYGSTIVATPVAAKGIEAEAGRDYLEASDPRDFAEAVASSLRGERPDLGNRAREVAVDRYSIESLRERLRAA